MKKHIPEELIHNYNISSGSQEEIGLVESWHLKDLAESQHLPSRENISIVHQRTWERLSSKIGYSQIYDKPKKLWPKVAIAASVCCMIALIVYIYTNKQTSFNTSSANLIIQNDIAPGMNLATLTLSDGKRIRLDDGSPDGLLAKQGNIKINKTREGRLVYQQYAKVKDLPSLFNKLETPRAGKYQITLPDQTKVWLNAASSLTYPTKFEGNDRKILLNGEAYFEVAKDPHRPFRIISNHQIVEVLGTHFNIKAYSDEIHTQTTLLEGKIKLSREGTSRILKEGQVAFTSLDSKMIQVAEADIEKNLAWKNNVFIFNGEDLKAIMKSISRWYDVDVIYQSPPDQTKYWGVISRSNNLSEVLKMLQSTEKVNFRIKGRRIIIMD